MAKNIKIAVVILNWNGEDLLTKFLPSVITNSQNENVEIIVADNGSTDNSINLLKSKFPEVTILDLEKNYGFAKGYNVALQQIEAEYFVLLNSDVEVAKNWIEPCIAQMEENSKIAAVQPKVLSYNQKELFEYAGAAGGFIDILGYPFCRGRILNVCETDTNQFDQPSPIFWATGACMFVRADVFKNNGGFDEDFWAHMEEIDLCWRIKNEGYSVWYEPQSTVYHLGGGTLSYDSPKKLYLNFRNNFWMLFKNLPRKQFLIVFLFRMVLDGVAALKFAVGLNFGASFAILRAHLSFYRNFPKLLKKRRKLNQKRQISFHPEIYKGSLMWQFYFKKNRHFNKLNFKP